MKHISEMTRKEFEAIKHRKWDEPVEFDSMIILPGRIKDMHDSGYRCMDFVAVKDNEPVCLLSGCSDVIHIDGIGGFGYKWLSRYGKCPDKVEPVAWSIDCLPKSGLLRLFTGSGKMRCDAALSSFEVYSLPKDKGEE